MSAPSVDIETRAFDADRGGWIVQCVSIIAGVTRRGPEFVALPDTATEAELQAAIVAAYAP
jgi:hypothetical protein